MEKISTYLFSGWHLFYFIFLLLKVLQNIFTLNTFNTKTDFSNIERITLERFRFRLGCRQNENANSPIAKLC